jgi:hypothetical protein
MSLTNEEQQQQNSLAKVKLAVDTVFSAQVETARILGASDDALKAMNNTFKFHCYSPLFKLFVKSIFVVNIETIK